MTLLYPTCPVFELPLQRGGDVWFGVVYRPLVTDEDGAPVLDGEGKRQYAEANYPPGCSVQVVIETNPPASPNVTIEAEIEGSMAIIWEQSEVVDLIPAGKLWRAVITFADGLDKVLVNGKTGRYDG